jgi:MoaA/NifB/PqqE/SkfB family radical SAM enzyme
MLDSVRSNRAMTLDECERGAPVVGGLPFYYSVHLNMPCNERCIMCVPDGRHRKDIMALDDFRHLVEQIRPYAHTINILGGEPFMYPWICEALEILASNGMTVSVITNATLLNDRVAGHLLALNELYMKCSIDGATAETYRRIRGLDVFDRVTANLGAFAQRARQRSGINIVPVYVVMRENLHEVLPFLDYAKQFHPQRVAFHPVRQVAHWRVQNGTGWTFDGREQSCEFFRDEYNEVMSAAAEKAEREGMRCEITWL